MVRAGVFIGVDRSGDLQQLQDAAAGAKAMYEWALAQGMPDKTHAKLITDSGGRKVQPDQIAEAIQEICQGAGVDQLIVYFAGHGINIRGDRWLLTDAPTKTYAAVNVLGSVELARMCGIPHVVFIADACRVAAADIQQANIDGIDIFPNTPGGDRSRPIDQFFACYLGRTAAEVKTSDERANYSALYTGALTDAIRGARPELLQPGGSGDAAQYIKPWPLHDYLVAEIPRRVKALKLEKKVNQNPDSIITSRDSWVARIEQRPGATRTGGGGPPPPPPPPAPPAPPNLRSVSRAVTASATEGKRGDMVRTLEAAVEGGVPGAAQLARTWQHVAEPFGPPHFETACGIKVRGARIINVVAPLASTELLGGGGDLLRIDQVDGPGASVLLRFDNRTACVVPAIQGFLAALTFDGDDLVDVAYEPSDNTWRWDIYKDRADEVRALRAAAAAASRHGRFRLDEKDADRVGRQMQYAKGIDPALAVYAAYAYHDLQLIDRIREMSDYLRGDVGVTLFDLELLCRRLAGRSIRRDEPIVPFVPMLAQGWSLLSALRVTLPPALDGIDQGLRDSLWTQFDFRASEQLEGAMRSGAVR
jgi:hypothetical protein